MFNLWFIFSLIITFFLKEITSFKSEREVSITNKCDYTIWIGIYGYNSSDNQQWGPDNGGFQLNSQAKTTLNIPSGWYSGRIWGRTNCKWDTSQNPARFECDTGACWSAVNNYGKDGICCYDNTCISGMPPASVIEFTLGSNQNQNDFYDLSLVDGYNLPVSITPINFNQRRNRNKNKNNNDNNVDDNYYCTSAVINTFNSASSCPSELQYKGTGSDSNKVYCLSICKALYDDDMRENSEVLQKYWTSTAYGYKNNYDYGMMKDLLCCDCGSSGACENLGTSCTFGCSPFANYPSSYNKRICPNNGTISTSNPTIDTNLPDWPLATNGVNYAYIYKQNSPDAYSWQFNDAQSTFQCNDADYDIVFCP